METTKAAPKTIADQLETIQRSHFIGRHQEIDTFRRALAGDDRRWLILNTYGPGGIGKSTLLDAYRRVAEESGAHYFYLDAINLNGAHELFIQQLVSLLPDTWQSSVVDLETLFATLSELCQDQAVVLTIDTYEEVNDLNQWLREEFFPRLPLKCIIVIAGRYSLTDLWHDSHAWCRLIHPMPLDNFSHELTEQYLRFHGITEPALIEKAWQYTSGYPLALSLVTTLAQREGPEAILRLSDDTNIVSELTQRWLREVPDPKLRTLIQAATAVRCFNQDLLTIAADQPITDQEFRELLSTSFVRKGRCGWSIHSVVRHALASELAQRMPETYAAIRLRALHALAHMATSSNSLYDRTMPIQEFFYLLGDSLVRAALYQDETGPTENKYHVETATLKDLQPLLQYMEDWRTERGVLSKLNIELIDKSSNSSILQQVVSEPREPEFLNIDELLSYFPSSIRTLKDYHGNLHGLTIVLPINSESIEYLKTQAFTGSYFSALTDEEANDFKTPIEQTSNWFIRLIDIRDNSDNIARATLFLDLVSLLIRPARFITSTPLAFYQALLTRFGFTESKQPAHYDCGVDRPSPYYELDIRGNKLPQYLNDMIRQHMGDSAPLPFDSLLNATQHFQNRSRNIRALNAAKLEQLTEREREVVLAAVEGLANCAIAAKLDIAEITVKKHMSSIFGKLGVRNRSELIKAFWSMEQNQPETENQ